MAVPTRRTSKTRKAKRRSHEALKAANLSACPSCGEQIKSHTVCPSCGMYDGKKILNPKAKAE